MGLKLIQGELENISWEETLHQMNNINDDDTCQHAAINGAILKLYHNFAINYTKSNRTNHLMTLIDSETRPLKVWNGHFAGEFLQHRSHGKTDHNGFANSIAAHPKLPIFVVGNNYGILSTFEFNQTRLDPTSLEEFSTSDPILGPRRSLIDKI